MSYIIQKVSELLFSNIRAKNQLFDDYNRMLLLCKCFPLIWFLILSGDRLLLLRVLEFLFLNLQAHEHLLVDLWRNDFLLIQNHMVCDGRDPILDYYNLLHETHGHNRNRHFLIMLPSIWETLLFNFRSIRLIVRHDLMPLSVFLYFHDDLLLVILIFKITIMINKKIS